MKRIFAAILLILAASLAKAEPNNKPILHIGLTRNYYVSPQTHTFPALDTNNAFTGNETHSGTETFTNINNILFVGPGGYSSIAAAITAAGSSRTTIIIRGDYVGVECPAAVSISIQFIDWRGGNIICQQNVVTMNSVDTTGVNALQRAIHQIKGQTLVSTGSPVSYYDEMYLDNVNFNGAQADGGSSDLNFFGANSGTLTRASGNETETVFFGTASGNPSTGGSVTEATGGHGYVSTFAGSTTAINIATGYEAIGCATITGSIPVQCFGLYARAQTTGAGGKASSRSYSVATEGVNLAMYDANAVGGARSGWDFENTAHNVFPVLFNNSSDNVILRGTGATGIFLQDSSANNLLQISPATVAIFGATTQFFPVSVNAVDVGAASNPFRNLYLGTAATNNFKFQPAATAAARTWVIPDWGAFGLATQQQPATVILHTAYTNATTTFSTLGDGTRTISFPVSASVDYLLTCDIVYQSSATTAGPKIQVTGPASPTAVSLSAEGGTGAAAFADAAVTAFSTPLTSFGTAGATATNFALRIVAGIANGVNAGTVALQLAANGVGTLTVNAGSACRIQ